MTGYQSIVIAELPRFLRGAITELVAREGGYVNHEADYETKHGIRRYSADAAGYRGEIRDIDVDTASRIYASNYWFRPKFDVIADVSPLIAQTMLDTGVVAGAKVAILHLQAALTTFNAISAGTRIYGDDLIRDGVIGPKTVAQLEAYISHREKQNGERILASRLNALQDAHFVDVALRLPAKRVFSFGWSRQRVYADLEQIAGDETALA